MLRLSSAPDLGGRARQVQTVRLPSNEIKMCLKSRWTVQKVPMNKSLSIQRGAGLLGRRTRMLILEVVFNGVPQLYLGGFRRQNIGVRTFWVREKEAEEECRRFRAWVLGREFKIFGGGGTKPWKKQGRIIRGKNLPSEFAQKFDRHFPYNSPGQHKNSPQFRSADHQDQLLPP